MIKIAIAGKACSGKNTVAEIIKDRLFKLDVAPVIFAFADPIKHMVMKMFPATPKEILWGPSENRATIIPGTNKTYRQLLTELGKLGRRYNCHIWIEATFDEITKEQGCNADPLVAIISDLRFQEELQRLQAQDYYLIRVCRPNNPTNDLTDSSTITQDISETDLDDIPDSEFDAIIINDTDVASLQIKVKSLDLFSVQ